MAANGLAPLDQADLLFAIGKYCDDAGDVERAFRNPFSSITKDSTGVIPSTNTLALKSSSGNFDSASAVELSFLRRMNQVFMKSLPTDVQETDDEDTVKLDLTPDGIRINVFDRPGKPVFEPQSTKFTPYGDWVFETLAWEISRVTNFCVELEGHTESGNPPISKDYGDWDISTDRSTAVRRACGPTTMTGMGEERSTVSATEPCSHLSTPR